MVAMRYYGNVSFCCWRCVYWACYRCILHLQEYSHRLNLLYYSFFWKVPRLRPFALLVRTTCRWMSSERQWNDPDRGKLKYRETNLSPCHFVHPMHPVHNFTPHFPEIHFNIIILHTPKHPLRPLSLRFSHQKLSAVSSPHACFIPHPSRHRSDHPNNVWCGVQSISEN